MVKEIIQELSPLFRPHQITFRVPEAQTVTTTVRTCLRQSHAGIVGIEHILAALPVEDTQGDEHAVQLRSRHRHLLGDLCGGQTVHTLQHLVTVVRLLAQQSHLRRQQLVATALADGRQHLTGHPALESLRLPQLGGEDQGVETALVDE